MHPTLFSISALDLAVSYGLGLVFFCSAVYKFRAPFATSIAILRFGLKVPTNRSVGYGAATLELCIAASLMLAPLAGAKYANIASMGATAALALFTGLVVRSLRRGETFSCACFSADQPISQATVVRNSALLLLALGSTLASPSLPNPADHIGALLTAVATISVWSLMSRAAGFIRYDDPFLFSSESTTS